MDPMDEKPVDDPVASALIGMIPHQTEDLLLIVDAARRPLWRNPAMGERISAQRGVEPEHVLDWIMSQVEAAVDFDKPRQRQGVEESDRVERVIQLNDSHGRQEWYQVSVMPCVHDGTHHYSIALHDVTDIKHREQNLVEANSMIEHRLNHDPSSGLPNRRALAARLEQALRQPTAAGRPALLIVELQQFRELTNIHGPSAAEEVLQELCVAILEFFEEEPFVARTGSHEFAVLLEPAPAREDLAARASGLRNALRLVVDLGSGRVTTDVRIAVVQPDAESRDPDAVLTDAQIALHHPGPVADPTVRLYARDMRELLETRARVYSELNEALRLDQIEPFFQPQIRLSDGGVTGLEVLARWRHPERGLVPPGVFLGIAEETGLLPRIDNVILNKAIAQVALWRQAGHDALRVSLNASGFALRDPSFVDRLMLELDRRELGSDAVAIEILESVGISGQDDPALATITKLKRAGFHLELDDFGTGYASIAMLVTMDVDTVKLDRSLITDICNDVDSRTIVETTLVLANQLKLTSLAEGVETEEHLVLLHELGCTYAQGYGIARPMSAEQATAWLAERPAGNDRALRRTG